MAKLAEYFNPIGISSYLASQHIDRYLFARNYVKPRDLVLDIACGSGYGSIMLVKSGCEVVGADYDEELIPEIRNVWNYHNFIYANALDLPFGDNYFDVVVSFETVEHVTEGEQFISEMHRVLKPGGLFLCSTPNIMYTAHPKFHVKEYMPDEFFQLVQAKFSHVEKFGQYFKPTDRLNDIHYWIFNNGSKDFSTFTTGAVWFLKKCMVLVGKVENFAERIFGLKQAKSNKSTYVAPNNWDEEIERICSGSESEYYYVQPYKGPAWLRIMIAVSVKN